MNDFEILYEDENILAINKPSGILVHPDTTGANSVSDWLSKKYPDMAHVGEPARLSDGSIVARPGIVHRLDKETSGVLLIARNSESYLFLKEKFQRHEVEKTYRLFVHGEMKEEKGFVDRPIGKSASDFRKWSAQRGARGVLREAITEYKTLHVGNGFSYLEAYPKTGRTHQIRVHFKAINHPVVGDSLYAPNHEKLLGFERLALHAYQICFGGMQGESICIKAPLPKDFMTAEAKFINS